MEHATVDDRGLFQALLGDGRPLLSFTGLSLVLSGAFALFLSATGQFLPHDIQFLGMSADALCAINDCRVVRFMFHDRVAFGGALIAIGILYLWLVEFPLRQGAAWAWWTLLASGVWGFGSFLSYLGYGYLDTWHGVATLVLLPSFAVGLIRSRRLLGEPLPALRRTERAEWTSTLGLARLLLAATGLGMVAAGLTITVVGITRVFVPQDHGFIGLDHAGFAAINPQLVPLIAHDRAGYGGAIATTGFLVICCAWFAAPSRSLWQALALAGTVGFATAIGVHPAVGYTDPVHLAPAVAGALLFAAGLILAYRPFHATADPISTGTAMIGSRRLTARTRRS